MSSPPSRLRQARSIGAFVLGLALLAAAIWFAIGRGSGVGGEAIDGLRGAPVVLIVCAVVLPLVNWLLTSGAFWVLTNRFGSVGFGEMSLLIGSAWLLNHLPMRPGLLGRVAYHKRVNGVRVTDSVKVLVMTTGCTAVAMACLLGVAMAAHLREGVVSVLLVVPMVLGMAVWGALSLWDDDARITWRLAAAFSFRYADMLVWTGRYLLLFHLIGHPIGLAGAGAIAVTSQAASLSPIQVGLREWVVGLTRAALPAWFLMGDDGGASTAVGLTADLLNRAMETVCVVPLGLVSTAWVWRRLRAGSG